MSQLLLLLAYLLMLIASVLLMPMTSWALGRWYQKGLLNQLEVLESQHGKGYGEELLVSYQKKNDTMAAEYSTLLMANVVVGPSWGQMYIMWWKSLIGGSLPSYAAVLEYGRREALQRLKAQAREDGCTSVVNVRIETSVISTAKGNDSKSSSVEFLAYGTGVR